MNLAVEEAIIRSRREGRVPDTFRLWRNPASVVIGCHTDVESEVNLSSCSRCGIDVVRRPSGGGAVYHDPGNLNYTIIADVATNKIPSNIQGAYEFLSTGVIVGLQALGIRAEFDPPNSITVDGEKISGMAQHWFYNVLLHHGTLLVNADLKALNVVLTAPRDRVTNLREKIGRQIMMKEVKKTILNGFKTTFKFEARAGRLHPSELKTAQELFKIKYSSDKWNLTK